MSSLPRVCDLDLPDRWVLTARAGTFLAAVTPLLERREKGTARTCVTTLPDAVARGQAACYHAGDLASDRRGSAALDHIAEQVVMGAPALGLRLTQCRWARAALPIWRSTMPKGNPDENTCLSLQALGAGALAALFSASPLIPDVFSQCTGARARARATHQGE